MEQAQKNYLIGYAVVSILISGVVVFVPDTIRSGFFIKLIAFCLASAGGFIGFLLGDLLRRFAAPDLIFTSGGFWGMLKARFFWMCGPQLIGIVIGSVFAASLVLDTESKGNPPGN